jgi:hypothetical protein
VSYGYISVPGVGGSYYTSAAQYEYAQSQAYADYAASSQPYTRSAGGSISGPSAGTSLGGSQSGGSPLSQALGAGLQALNNALNPNAQAQGQQYAGQQGQQYSASGATGTPYAVYFLIGGFILLAVLINAKGR